jgi:hypothetical protein
VRCRTIRKLALYAADPAPRRRSAPRNQAGTCCIHSPARQIDAYTELERDLFIRRLPSGELLGRFEWDEKLAGDLGHFVLLDLVRHPAAPLVDEAGIELVLAEDVCQFVERRRTGGCKSRRCTPLCHDGSWSDIGPKIHLGEWVDL